MGFDPSETIFRFQKMSFDPSETIFRFQKMDFDPSETIFRFQKMGFDPSETVFWFQKGDSEPSNAPSGVKMLNSGRRGPGPAPHSSRFLNLRRLTEISTTAMPTSTPTSVSTFTTSTP